MQLDRLELLSDAQSVAIAAGSDLSTKSKDLGAQNTDILGNTPIQDVGRGVPVEIWCQVVTTCDSAEEDATLQVQLVMADDAALSTNLTVIADTGAIAEATLIAGYQFRFSTIPPGITRRYLGFKYTVAVHTLTTGKVSAGIVMAKQQMPQV